MDTFRWISAVASSDQRSVVDRTCCVGCSEVVDVRTAPSADVWLVPATTYIFPEAIAIPEGCTLHVATMDGESSAIFSGQGATRLFTGWRSSLSLRNIILEDGLASAGAGGALNLEETSLTVSQCVFRNNRAPGSGGAIALAGGTLSITETVRARQPHDLCCLMIILAFADLC